MFKTKKIHAYILLGLFIILIAGMWIVTNLKYRVIIKDNIFIFDIMCSNCSVYYYCMDTRKICC